MISSAPGTIPPDCALAHVEPGGSGRRPFSERQVLQLGLALAVVFVLLGAASGLASVGGLHGWVGIHLVLAGAATVAIGTFMPHFSVTLAGTRPEPAPRRLAGILALAAGMLTVALGRPALGDRVAGIGGLLVLVGVGLTAWSTYGPLRSGLARRHSIVQLTYGVALADVAVGGTLAIGLLLGVEGMAERWAALKLAHVWLNAMGFVSLTIAGTLVYLYPTMLGARIVAHPTMVVAVIGLVCGPPLVAIAAALGWSPLALAGGIVTLVGAVALLGYGITVWRRRGRWTADVAWHSLSARFGMAGMAWFVVAVAALLVGLARDGVAVSGWTVGSVVVPLVGGWTLQQLIGAASHLLPAVGPGDADARARQRRLLARWGTARVLGWNVGLVLLWPGLGLSIPALLLIGGVLFSAAVLSSIGLLVAALTVAIRPVTRRRS